MDPRLLALRLGDDCLVLSHRLSEWVSYAPEIEEDVALANLSLDLLGQARPLLTYAGTLDGRTEDQLAYERTDRDFTNCLLVELPRGDFAVTVVRQLLFASWQVLLYDRLVSSADETIAAVAAKGAKEIRYHVDHAAHWTRRLGDGTEESHRRAQGALDQLWPYHHELFEVDDVTASLVEQGIQPDPRDLYDDWRGRVTAVLTESTLVVPDDAWRPTGGRSGLHTEHLGYLLAEMQSVARTVPGATW